MADTVDYYIGDELEPLQLWWEADDVGAAAGELVDFSVTHSYTMKVAPISSSTAAFTKTSLITGAVGSGTKRSGTPNLTAQWATSGELNSLTTAGKYRCEIVAVRTSDGRERTGLVFLNMKSRLS